MKTLASRRRNTREEREPQARRQPDWRHDKPAWLPPRTYVIRREHMRRWLRRAGAWALRQIHPDPRERRKIYIYLTAMTWLVMISIGLLAAHGVHP